jgi:hypothetical protein
MRGREKALRDFVIEAIHGTFRRANVVPKRNARGSFLDP